jgi:hypothetical protein
MNPPFLAGVILAAGNALNEAWGALWILLGILFLYFAFKDGWDRA